MAKEPLFTMVAGGALEVDTVFNVKCNCGGNAPIIPKAVKGYGFSKSGGAMKMVDNYETVCESCNTTIKVLVIEGNPSYVLTGNEGTHKLFLSQGSTSPPVSSLSPEKQQQIIAEMKTDMDRLRRAKKKEEIKQEEIKKRRRGERKGEGEVSD